MRRTYFKIAGLLNAATALLHAFAGQLDLVNPLYQSALTTQQKAEWISAWHMVTLILGYTALVLLKAGFAALDERSRSLLQFVGVLYVLFALPFIASSIFFGVFAPQWVLLMPIGVLVLLGLRE